MSNKRGFFITQLSHKLIKHTTGDRSAFTENVRANRETNLWRLEDNISLINCTAGHLSVTTLSEMEREIQK
jgi:hypothetical protein